MDFLKGSSRDTPSIKVEELHGFFEYQAQKTGNLRRYLYRKAGLIKKERVLDAGCGTGTITNEISEAISGEVIGVDRKPDLIEFARGEFPDIEFVAADCASLPFPSGSFDLVVSHFFLMWVESPERIIDEITRVLKPDGIFIATAEPDYGGRIEYPENPGFNEVFCSSLTFKGADVLIGRKLKTILESAGLGVEAGISSNLLSGMELQEEFEANRPVYEHDLKVVLDEVQTERIIQIERKQIEQGKMLTVPIFWAMGRKPL